MPLLLLLPLLVVVVALAWALLLPLSLRARYRNGRARRRLVGWAIRVNAGLLGVSALVYLLSAWIASHWFADALRDAALGLVLGLAVGALGVALTRFERDAAGDWFTPNRWVVLGLTMLIAARILVGLWLSARGGADLLSAGARPAQPDAWLRADDWLRGGGWLGIGGMLLGYPLAYAIGLRARLPRATRRPLR
jgi:hypothetical protein